MVLLLIIPTIFGAYLCGLIFGGLTDVSYKYVLRKTKNKSLTTWIMILAMGLLIPALMGFFAYSTLGGSSCAEYTDSDNRGSTCISYNDDGFEATSEQKTAAFTRTFFVSSFALTSLTVVSMPDIKRSKEILAELE